MVHIIGESSPGKGVFAQFALDQESQQWIIMKFQEMVASSFNEDRTRRGQAGSDAGREIKVTESEIKRRMDILTQWFRVLRGDYDWTYKRIFDSLGQALRAELDGEEWSPPSNNLWVAPSG